MSASHAHQIALRHAIDPFAVHENRAGVRSKQTENQLQHDRLPAAARAKEDGHASLRNAEADIPQDDVVVERKRDPVEHHRRRDRGVGCRQDRRRGRLKQHLFALHETGQPK